MKPSNSIPALKAINQYLQINQRKPAQRVMAHQQRSSPFLFDNKGLHQSPQNLLHVCAYFLGKHQNHDHQDPPFDQRSLRSNSTKAIGFGGGNQPPPPVPELRPKPFAQPLHGNKSLTSAGAKAPWRVVMASRFQHSQSCHQVANSQAHMSSNGRSWQFVEHSPRNCNSGSYGTSLQGP